MKMALVASLALLGNACGPSEFTGPMRFGDRVVAVETLETGKHLFGRFCSTCHGYDGKADTAPARQLTPRPRDLTLAIYTRHERGAGALPSDEDLARVITHGIPGTAMPAFANLEAADVDAISQYLKTFSPKWQAPAPSAGTEKTQGEQR